MCIPYVTSGFEELLGCFRPYYFMARNVFAKEQSIDVFRNLFDYFAWEGPRWPERVYEVLISFASVWLRSFG